jgi:hypothetical protein
VSLFVRFFSQGFSLFIFEYFVNRMDGNAGTGFGMSFVGRWPGWPCDQMVGLCHRLDGRGHQEVQRSLRSSLFRPGGIKTTLYFSSLLIASGSTMNTSNPVAYWNLTRR